ncbi:MAG: SDR family NAD(P)-dependent oxidoreductase [Alphaproteobacteria bacterium]
MTLEGKTILITGAAGELGSRLIQAMIAAGAKAIIGIDVNAKKLDTMNSVHFSGFACDLTDYKQVHSCLEGVYAKYPTIDVLINNAGILHSAPLVNILEKDDADLYRNAEDWSRCLNTNLSSTFYVTQFVARKMVKARTHGVILNISSVSAEGTAGQSAYSASKAGMEALTQVWAKELSGFGIRSIAIAPGYMDTPSTHAAVSEAQLKEITGRIPMKKLGNPNSIIEACLFTINNEYINGTVLEVHGGLRV